VNRAIRMGILGAGRIARAALIQPASHSQNVTVACIASRSSDRGKAFAASHGIPHVFASYDALLDDRSIDAVYVALPPALHPVWTHRALDRGKHVLCEKPLAPTAALAQAMVAAARNRGLVLQEAMHLQYLEGLRRQRQLVTSGEFGPVLHVASVFRYPDAPMIEDDFRLRFELGGGAALDGGCYAVTCLRHLAREEPIRVHDVTVQLVAPQVDGWMQAHVGFPSGATGIIECGFRGAFSLELGVGVQCELGAITWTPQGVTWSRGGQKGAETIPWSPTYELQLQAFVNQIRGEPSDALSPEDAIATARVIDSMYEHAGLSPRVERSPVP
jgi:predicted dehydrogenase